MAQPTEYSARRSKSPYKIQVAPGFNRDGSETMNDAFLQRRAEEEAVNNSHDQLIGNLDTLSSDFMTLFTTMSTIRSKVDQTMLLPFLKKQHLNKLKLLSRYVDDINKIITLKVIPEIDELGR